MSATTPEIAAMSYPMRCKYCHDVHDAGAVTVIQRYADCSVWKCPNCGHIGDDRPLGWGGSFERVTAEVVESRRFYGVGEFGGQS